MKKRSLITLLIFLVLLVAAIGLSFTMLKPRTGSAEKSVTEFVQLLREGKLYDAFRTSAAIVKSRSFESFEAGIDKAGLTNWRSIEWIEKEIGATEARFRGTIRKENHEDFPLTLNLVKEAGGWRMFALVSERTGSILREETPTEQKKTDDNTLPSEDEIKTLAYDTLLKFNEAVQIKYFGPFYQQISTAWQRQTTPSALDDVFRSFMDQNISFGTIRKEDFVFLVTPVLTPEGLLDVRGYVPQASFRVNFDLKYVKERSQWRLFGLTINLSESK